MTQQPIAVIPEFTVCDRLRKARELTGLDQDEFAAELDVSRGTVSNYERNPNAAFKAIVMKAWAMRTSVPREWLETGIAPTDDGGGDGGFGPESGRRDSNSQHSAWNDEVRGTILAPAFGAAAA